MLYVMFPTITIDKNNSYFFSFNFIRWININMEDFEIEV